MTRTSFTLLRSATPPYIRPMEKRGTKSERAKDRPTAAPAQGKQERPRLMPPPEVSLGLEDFAAPADDQGLSLEELGQAYAAMLHQGADPYPQPGDPPSTPATSTTTTAEAAPTELEEPPRVIDGTDDDGCEITPRSILEAILFVGHPQGEPLTSTQIAALMRGVRTAEIDELVVELNEKYDELGTAYTIASIGAGYQLQLRSELSPLRDKFYGRVREAKLSQVAVDILAVVAYHQPISQEQIDKMRAKPCGGMLSQLVRRELLRVERDPTAGPKAKPKYVTTDRFLDLFGLESLAELPRSHDPEKSL